MKLKERGLKNVCAIDVDNYLHESIRNETLFYRLDVCQNFLPFEEGEVAGITALFLLEHLENPWFFVREVSRVLKRGGVFIVAVPHAHSLWSKCQFVRSGNVSGYREENNHITFLSTAVWKKLFKDFLLMESVLFAKPYCPYLMSMNTLLQKIPRRFYYLFAQQACYIFQRK